MTSTKSTWRVPATDLPGQYETMRTEIDASISEVLSSGDYIRGRYLTRFERQFASYCSASYALGVASGTDALTLALLAMEIGPGDEVITTPVTFIGTVSAIARTGATPVFVDIDRQTFNIDPAAVAAAVTSKSRAILPVHLFGLPAEMDELRAVADSAGIFVLEDAAQAVGSRYRGKPTGALGDAAAFSFFPTKNLGCYGDGGALVTNNRSLAREVLVLREHGFDGDVSVRFGLNSRLDAIHASVLSTKLRGIDEEIRLRREVAARYDKLLIDTAVITPFVPADRSHSYYQYTVLVPESRDDAVGFLRRSGVDARSYYSSPLHLQPALAYLGYRLGQLPEAENHAVQAISLPCHPRIDTSQQEYVADLLDQCSARQTTL